MACSLIDRPIGWLKRVLGERCQYVGQEQLLMLLFVIDAQLGELQRNRRKSGQRLLKRIIDRNAPGANVIKAGSADHAAPRTGVTLTFALIIAVEEVGPALVMQAITRDMIAKDEGFEEPAGVRQVPLRGGGVGMGLDGRIRIRQRCGEIERQPPGRGQALAQFLAMLVVRSGHTSPPSQQ